MYGIYFTVEQSAIIIPYPLGQFSRNHHQMDPVVPHALHEHAVSSGHVEAVKVEELSKDASSCFKASDRGDKAVLNLLRCLYFVASQVFAPLTDLPQFVSAQI